MKKYLFFVFLLFALTNCKRDYKQPIEPQRPVRTMKEYFDSKYLLYLLPDSFYERKHIEQTFTDINNSIEVNGVSVKFLPLGYSTDLNLQYTHIYSDQCVYSKQGDIWKYAEICFPNTCLTKDKAYAKVLLKNSSDEEKHLYIRLFYQNTSYWYSTANTQVNLEKQLENFYGCSTVMEVVLQPEETKSVMLPYSIGLDPKVEMPSQPYKVPARAGNYEFALLVDTNASEYLMLANLDLKATNPFSDFRREEGKWKNRLAYVGAYHFKFVVHEEFFDGKNDLEVEHIYLTKDDIQKTLCDTCTGWHRKIIDEDWGPRDFFKGRIAKSDFVKAEYGGRSRNVNVDTHGITITVPASTTEHYQKTWGEVVFGPSFKYGHVTVRAKFADMFNRKGTANGMIHNLWLYETDPPEKPEGPYAQLTNPRGQQPFEIDMEFWSTNAAEGVWDDSFYINCSIIDYMRDANVQVKPGDRRIIDGEDVDRVNNAWQLLIIPKQFPREFLQTFHVYEIFWYPDRVEYYVDGQKLSFITEDWAKIPDSNMFLWFASPIYQEGNYYTISYLPFFNTPKYSVIDYIKVE